MWGWLALSISSCRLWIPLLGLHSMFDCPLHNHTSPNRISFSIILFSFLLSVNICRVYGPPCPQVGIFVLQRPQSSTEVEMVSLGIQLPTNLTVVLASPHPQIETVLFCWSTMWSENMAGKCIGVEVCPFVTTL